MRRLNRVRVDPERKTVFAEGGATCGDIYTALKPYPLAWRMSDRKVKANSQLDQVFRQLV